MRAKISLLLFVSFKNYKYVSCNVFHFLNESESLFILFLQENYKSPEEYY